MTGPRDALAMGGPGPDLDLDGFPEQVLPAGSRVFRSHDRSNGPWYFSSSPGNGRFDLSSPHGTCYVASTPEAAAREHVGKSLAKAGRVPASLLKGRVISELQLPKEIRSADISADTLAFGVVGSELSAAVTYAVSCQWAAIFHGTGYGGICYVPRFSGVGHRAWALFGDQGEAVGGGFRRDPSPTPVRSVVEMMPGVKILEEPTLPSQARIRNRPPTTGK